MVGRESRRMAWFLRAIELPEGRWACRWSEVEYDRHNTVEEAVEHLRTLAAEIGPATLFVHHLSGTVRQLDGDEGR